MTEITQQNSGDRFDAATRRTWPRVLIYLGVITFSSASGGLATRSLAGAMVAGLVAVMAWAGGALYG